MTKEKCDPVSPDKDTWLEAKHKWEEIVRVIENCDSSSGNDLKTAFYRDCAYCTYYAKMADNRDPELTNFCELCPLYHRKLCMDMPSHNNRRAYWRLSTMVNGCYTDQGRFMRPTTAERRKMLKAAKQILDGIMIDDRWRIRAKKVAR